MLFKRRMNKVKVVHLHNRVLLSSEKNNILKFAGRWRKLEKYILSEVTKTKKDKHGMYSHISGYKQ